MDILTNFSQSLRKFEKSSLIFECIIYMIRLARQRIISRLMDNNRVTNKLTNDKRS